MLRFINFETIIVKKNIETTRSEKKCKLKKNKVYFDFQNSYSIRDPTFSGFTISESNKPKTNCQLKSFLEKPK